MAVERLSPGVYRINGKTVRGADPKAAQAAYDKQYGKPTTAPKPTATQTTTAANNQLLNNNKQVLGQQVGAAINTDAKVQQAEQLDTIKGVNADYIGPDGSSTVEIDPATGKPKYTVTRSDSQQQIANNQDALTNMGTQFAQERLSGLGNFNPTLTERTNLDRSKVEDAVYSSLTRDLDGQEQRANESADQQLANRGIPYSNDPNSQYQQMKGDITKSFGDQRLQARNQAVITGGNEYRSDAGLNETQRANDYSIQSGAYGTNLGAAQAASQLGGGLRDTGAAGYTGAGVDYTNPTELALQQTALKIQQQQVNQAKRPAAGSGGTPSSTGTAWGG